MEIKKQKEILDFTKKFRYIHNYPTYPPYHEGPYMEEYFYNFFVNNIEEFTKGERYYLPIWWTDYYIANKHKDGSLQEYLNSLDKNLKYFTITQHDNAIQESYDIDLLHYSAGGNKGDVYLPLICSSMKDITRESRNIFASFQGYMSDKRKALLGPLFGQPQKYVMGGRGFWRSQVPKEEQDVFRKLMANSIFAICPRGVGATSFRMYEAMQYGTIPIYISDKHCLPWSDELDWNEFCVIVKPNEVSKLDGLLSSFSQDKIDTMIKKIDEVYPKYFSLEGMCKNILKRI